MVDVKFSENRSYITALAPYLRRFFMVKSSFVSLENDFRQIHKKIDPEPRKIDTILTA